MEPVLFYLLSALSIISAFGIIFFRTPIYSALSLISCMLGLAGLYALLNAHFLAVIQVAVYAGAIMVLVLFVIMLLNINAPTDYKRNKFVWGLSFILFAFVIYQFLPVFFTGFSHLVPDILQPAANGTVENLGKILFTRYVFTFELASALLLSALVGAVLIASKKNTKKNIEQ